MRTLSAADERRITSALEKVADLVSAGDHPTDAVAKAASDAGVPAGHVRLMVNAYNVGRSEAHRKTHDDVFDKAAEFDLADADEVVDRMFPAATKTAAARTFEGAVSPEYASPPRFLQDREKREKAARLAPLPERNPPPAYPTPPGRAAEKSLAKLASLRRNLEELSRKAQEQYDLATGLFGKLAAELKSVSAPRFSSVRDNCVAAYGLPAKVVFDKLAAQNKVLAKQAASKEVHPFDPSKGVYKTVASLMDRVEKFAAAKEAYEAAAAGLDLEVKKALDPFAPPPPKNGPVFGAKQANFLSGLFGTSMGSSIGRELAGKVMKPEDSLQKGMLGHMTDPRHEAQLRNIQTEAMLTDLMANDDVIAGYDPAEVVNHFNEISQLAPRASNQSGLMRSLLRRRLQQGAFDPFEADMLLKIENSLKTRDNPVGEGVLRGPIGVL